MQLLLVVILGVGLVNHNVSVVVNGALALGVTFLPAMLRRDFSIPLNPALTLWITTAVLLHAVGMLGLYDSVWWWDHLTHTMSAALVAGVGYTTVRALDVHLDSLHFPPRFMFVFVLVFTLSFGVVWEVLEFGVRVLATLFHFKPVLVQYSLGDTVEDLVFDLVGGTLVALFGTQLLGGVVEAVEARLN